MEKGPEGNADEVDKVNNICSYCKKCIILQELTSVILLCS